MSRVFNRFLLAGMIGAGCIMTSCSSDTPDSPDSGKGTQVAFDVSGLSRASVTTSINNFAVYGDMTFIGEGANTPTIIFNKTEVVKTGNSWTYQGTQYWVPKHVHSFVAVHPLTVLEPENSPVYSESKLTFSYHLPMSDSGVGDGADIIAATHRRLYQEDDANTTTVFTFSHLMSMVNFTLTSESGEDSFYIHRLELKGIKTGASFRILPASLQNNNQTDDRVTEVSGQEGNGHLVMDYEKPVNISSIIMLPQALAADGDVELVIAYSQNESDAPIEASASLSGLTWESGKSYNYKMMVTGEGSDVLLVGATTITAWTSADLGEIKMVF